MSTPYPDSVRFLYALGNEHRTIKLGLERIRTLLAHLGDPHRDCRFIHVAGTNGKGSTCAMIERTLREAGVLTGLYTSPHLAEPVERIRILGRPVPFADFARAFDEVHGAAERLIAAGAIDMHPTYFETITAMAFLLFRQYGVETVVLETGMGGRLDATNVVDPVISVITPIDFDHEKWLGNTLAQIAFEKAGIIKPGRPVVVARQRPEAMAVFERRAAELGAPLERAADWRTSGLELHAFGSRFRVHGPGGVSFPVEQPLIGAHQVENALTAVAALHQLGYTPAQIRRGIAATDWPGRLELVRRSPDIFLDGAHNPAGARALAGYLRHFHHGRRIWMIFAAMRDKNLRALGGPLFPLASELIFTAPAQTRAFTPEELRELSGESRARTAPDIRAALGMASAAAPEDLIVITGSLYLVGEARELLVG
ncbi:MAG: bifunctional folylpolyglutamate synthase/dihydrofolate synthase [Bryobacteraceae bacterium]|nr:bifunctional folylpolyglutamate synthase/dihydrofolate synthase [Bryobacteraceae bacterium]